MLHLDVENGHCNFSLDEVGAVQAVHAVGTKDPVLNILHLLGLQILHVESKVLDLVEELSDQRIRVRKVRVLALVVEVEPLVLDVLKVTVQLDLLLIRFCNHLLCALFLSHQVDTNDPVVVLAEILTWQLERVRENAS